MWKTCHYRQFYVLEIITVKYIFTDGMKGMEINFLP